MTVSILKLGNAIEIERTNVDTLRTKLNERHDSVLATLDTHIAQQRAMLSSMEALRHSVVGMKHATDEELDAQHEALRVIVEGSE